MKFLHTPASSDLALPLFRVSSGNKIDLNIVSNSINLRKNFLSCGYKNKRVKFIHSCLFVCRISLICIKFELHI